uniref:Uncharacterized protein n=1 Tax=Chlamydomonas euryale TaxID=1486919 RepID=A0A7R9YT02_9CHLO
MRQAQTRWTWARDDAAAGVGVSSVPTDSMDVGTGSRCGGGGCAGGHKHDGRGEVGALAGADLWTWAWDGAAVRGRRGAGDNAHAGYGREMARPWLGLSVPGASAEGGGRNWRIALAGVNARGSRGR